MKIIPIGEDEASESVLRQYTLLKNSLETSTLPLFFTYIGPFPKYLDYITVQLSDNLKNSSFKTLSQEISDQLLSTIQDTLPHSSKLQEWKARYRQSPSFYHFQNDLKEIYQTNVKLAFIFIALREAVKGWAVAAKKLPGTHQEEISPEPHTPEINEQKFVYDDLSSNLVPLHQKLSSTSGTIEKNLLPEYLHLTHEEFSFHLKTTEFWPVRLGIEKMMLNSITLMPHIIFSPINIVLQLTAEYKDFPELLHLLSDHFPTYSIHRLIYSGFMRDVV